LAIANFDLFGPFKLQLSGRPLNSKQSLPETVIGILNEFPNDEVKSAVLH
jgi:hypothetical protein